MCMSACHIQEMSADLSLLLVIIADKNLSVFAICESVHIQSCQVDTSQC